ncbi:MAG: IMPACT family protein [Flavobacteriales bacterium]
MSELKLIVSHESTYSLRDNKSTFTAHLFPILNEATFKMNLERIKKQHPKASHFCFAYQYGEPLRTRANDDGEPSGSAGLPILGQLKSNQLTHVGCVVVRYYGGAKLGIPGLIAAYKNASLGAIQANECVPYKEYQRIQITGNYSSLMRLLSISSQQGWDTELHSLQDEPVVIVHIEHNQVHVVIDKISLFSDLTWL